ncbi:MAG: CPBP family intramembrane glutamic endopeptidase [Planctomycetota bacterium]|jgi:hypothetical protein
MLQKPLDVKVIRLQDKIECLFVSLLLAFGHFFIPNDASRYAPELFPSKDLSQLFEWAFWILYFGYALVLALPTWKRSGLVLGNLRGNGWKLLVICGLPVLASFLLFRFFLESPFKEERFLFWLGGPLAQDLVFAGYLYGKIHRTFPGEIHKAIPLRNAAWITALYFGAYHFINLGTMDTSLVLFQVAYSFAGFIWMSLSRQITGSILYFTLAHAGANLMACM